MTGERLARLSLRFDAIYCVVLGLVVAVTAPFTAQGVALPTPLLVSVGGAVFVWGTYVWWASSQKPIRTNARLVMIANIAASLGLAATGLVAETTVLTLAACALAIDVSAFAVSQGIALRRLKGPAAA
ncbi:hypothetical protein ACI2IP_11645 [Microbacterium sp. NPDC090218]